MCFSMNILSKVLCLHIIVIIQIQDRGTFKINNKLSMIAVKSSLNKLWCIHMF